MRLLRVKIRYYLSVNVKIILSSVYKNSSSDIVMRLALKNRKRLHAPEYPLLCNSVHCSTQIDLWITVYFGILHLLLLPSLGGKKQVECYTPKMENKAICHLGVIVGAKTGIGEQATV
jgi:hypothetical protein